jgi:protein translocase SEC61 complex gamma subunit
MKKLEELQEFVHKCKYVLNVTQKPKMKQFKRQATVCAVGILFIGGIGFLVALAYSYFSGGL